MDPGHLGVVEPLIMEGLKLCRARERYLCVFALDLHKSQGLSVAIQWSDIDIIDSDYWHCGVGSSLASAG
jgi:hypothetical protein